MTDAVRIVPYEARFRQAFRTLNVEWLERYFEVEPLDVALLSAPEATILEPGGAILFALIDEDPVGTVALLAQADGSFELAKMAVTGRAQGRGIGRLLLDAAIDAAHRLGASHIHLETSEKLPAARKLYEEAGFRRVGGGGDPRYARPTFAMRLDLKPFRKV